MAKLPPRDYVRRRREKLGLTQLELAILADCSPASLRMIDRGYVPGNGSEVLTRVLAALDKAEEKAA